MLSSINVDVPNTVNNKNTSSMTLPKPSTANISPLRIAIIAHSLYPIAQPYAGGLEMITQLLCDELVAQGHDVSLYAHAESQTDATLIPLLTRDEFDAMVYENEHDSVGMSREELYQYLVYQRAMHDIIVRDERGEIDVVHNHSLHHIPMMLGQAFGSRSFTTFHTPIFPQLRLALLTLRQGTQTQFTAISGHQQQLFDEFVPSHVVYNGIDVQSFTANVDPIKDEVYFWFGRICPEKGTHLAMQYCKAAGKRLVIAGPKSNEDYFNQQVAPLLAEDEKNSQKNGVPKLFDYLGHLSKAEINDYLRQSTAMLFTSTWDEPYGLTLAESLACGTPVIGFNVGASAEIVTPSTGIIVPKEDKDAFVQAFASIKDISRQACRDRAEQFCSVATMVDGYVQLYKQALEDNSAINKQSIDKQIVSDNTPSDHSLSDPTHTDCKAPASIS
ncbi:glycosyltransferase family 4 protein [Psychrobacter frigidicola]|uniref:Glycosyltransferase family 4 protein n=1 Tax=Psychrobacter frigidicola TaxID=45611 RepID=A0A5C7A7B5_9GAMM|nr:glycosyltransferase family 4 protein [Psychrobacter frigidicola]TXD98434.1 glycosyltransferase family 4 protein [Psychrobacter frigidicola]